jgi:hypothetical protein
MFDIEIVVTESKDCSVKLSDSMYSPIVAGLSPEQAVSVKSLISYSLRVLLQEFQRPMSDAVNNVFNVVLKELPK